MKIPDSKRKKALILVDIQPIFLNKTNRRILPKIAKLLDKVEYDFYVNAVFFADKKSIWSKQTKWTVPKSEAKTESSILKLLENKKVLNITKQTKSVFMGDKDLFKILKKKKIEEVHLVGLDTNDCVLDSAYESFDYGFFTYAIEECLESSEGEAIHKAGLKLLRHVNLTNNSVIEKMKFITI